MQLPDIESIGKVQNAGSIYSYDPEMRVMTWQEHCLCLYTCPGCRKAILAEYINHMSHMSCDRDNLECPNCERTLVSLSSASVAELSVLNSQEEGLSLLKEVEEWERVETVY